MCGRYSIHASPQVVALQFALEALPEFKSSYNVCPGSDILAVRVARDGRRVVRQNRWGLVPHWAKDPKSVRQPINARAETLATAPMFRDALARRRCLVPADVFYEWQAAESGKLPYAIARADGQPMVFAGLWEGWRGADGTVMRTFTIVTTNASPALRPLHERMPVILEPVDWPIWLGESEGDPPALLRPSEAELRVWRVGTAVNNVRNDNAALLEPA